MIVEYRTAAVRHHNGSVTTLVKVEGSEDYKSFMRSSDSKHTHSNQENLPDNGDQKPLSATRSTEEMVRIIGSMLTAIKDATALQYGLNLSPALATFPNLADIEKFLVYQILDEAFAQADIRPLLNGPLDLRPAPIGAAAASNGLGLCDTYIKPDVCESEEAQLPEIWVLGIEYIDTSLTVTLSPFRASRLGFDRIVVRSWDLGAAVPKSDDYWTRVRETLQEIPRVWSHRTITDLVLMGDAALDEEFLDNVREALWDVIPKPVFTKVADPKARLVDPTFAVAMGAAEIAKRAMEAPDGCLERSYCDWWRRQIG
jgi:hypothetical protein